jgi:hypothetical protein
MIPTLGSCFMHVGSQSLKASTPDTEKEKCEGGNECSKE